MFKAKPTSQAIPQQSAIRARNVFVRKRGNKTPLEDALATANGEQTVALVRFARQQQNSYKTALFTWRENRKRWAEEAVDVFKWRQRPDVDEDGQPKIFRQQNDSLNVVASLAEFASAQAEQDLFGGEPWFASIPVGKSDPKLSESMQKHLQWTYRDGQLVQTYADGVTTAACLGEHFSKVTYEKEIDYYEAPVNVMEINGAPAMVDGKTIGSEREAADLVAAGALVVPAGAKITWRRGYQTREDVRFQGTRTTKLNHQNVAFREDAPKLELRFTNFYHEVEMSVSEAMASLKLSRADALSLARVADVDQAEREEFNEVDAHPDSSGGEVETVVFGTLEEEMLMNRRVRLLECWVRVDPFGSGRAINAYMVISTDQGDDRLWYCDYLANLTPKGALPVFCHVWEREPDRLYGRGFFAKYSHVQKQVDDLWNQIAFRNRMHSNPFSAIRTENIESEEDDPNIRIEPGGSVTPKAGKTLKECIEFLEMPDLDERSMELMQIGIQMVQLRSGITQASQGDMSALPENNTATGIRQLMSRAAVLIKKPIRRLRRSVGTEWQLTVNLFYGNFDRDEAFVWGEGEHMELLNMTAEQVRNLEIDCRMLLTQEQNQTKLESAQVASASLTEYLAQPEINKVSMRPLTLQIIKALEFDQADYIVRQPILTAEDAIAVLPPEEQNRLMLALQMLAQAQSSQPIPGAVAPGQPPTPTTSSNETQ